MVNEQESSEELDGEIFMSALQIQREQILAAATIEIQKYEEKAGFDENYIRNLRSQVDSQNWDLRPTLEGYMEASQAKARLRQEVSVNERALQENPSQSISRN